jgi:hypothetical protein
MGMSRATKCRGFSKKKAFIEASGQAGFRLQFLGSERPDAATHNQQGKGEQHKELPDRQATVGEVTK